jgi:hypothetical protein
MKNPFSRKEEQTTTESAVPVLDPTVTTAAPVKVDPMTQPGAFDVTFTVSQTSGITEDVTIRTLAQNRDAAIMHATMWMMSMVDVAEMGQDLPTFTNFANDIEVALHQASCPATLKGVRLELGIEEATSTLGGVLDDILK